MKKGKINIFVWRQEADENTRDIWVIVLYYHVDAFKRVIFTTLVDIFILYQMNKFKSKKNCNEVEVTSY